MIFRHQERDINDMLSDQDNFKEFFEAVGESLFSFVEGLQGENQGLRDEKEDLEKELETLKELYENLLQNNADLNAENEKLLDITRSIEL